MKKSSFTALVLGVVSGLLFALGMCMALLPQWNAFVPGVVCGGAGAVLGIITLLVWRKMTNKAPIHIGVKNVVALVVGIAGALLLGVGMCLCMVWNNLVLGIVVGIVGIVAILCLIPIIGGFKD